MGRNANGEGTYRKIANGNWQNRIMCEYPTELGKIKYTSGQGKTKAEAHRIAVERKKAWDKARKKNIIIDNEKRDALVSVLMLDWLEVHSVEVQWSSNTKRTRKKNIQNIVLSEIGSVKIKNITTDILDKLWLKQLENYSRQNLGMMYSLVKQFFADCTKKAFIDNNPCIDMMKLPSKNKVKEYQNIEDFEEENDNYKIFTEEEINKLFEFCVPYIQYDKPDTYLEYPYLPIYLVMFLTGLRGQEIRALTLHDIDFDSHTININKSLSCDENGKTIVKEPKTKNSRRIIGINALTEKYIHMIIDHRPNKDNSLLCCTRSGSFIEARNFSHAFDRILKACGIEKDERSPHSLRHTFISFAIEKNELSPLKNKEMLFISRYAGHANLTTTLNIYTHLQDSKLKSVDYDDGIKVEMIDIEYK